MLECVGAGGQTCERTAVWYVWHKSCGGLYTYACNICLAARLLIYSGTPDQVIKVDRIDKGTP